MPGYTVSSETPLCRGMCRFPWGADFGGGKSTDSYRRKRKVGSFRVRWGVWVSLKVNCRVSRSDELPPWGSPKGEEKGAKAIRAPFSDHQEEAAQGWWEGSRKKEYVSLANAISLKSRAVMRKE